MLILAEMPGWTIPIAVLFVLVALLLILVVLVQKGKGGGLGGAFGGAGGGGGGLLGTKTGDFLTWVTISLVILFFFFAIILVKYGKPKADQELMNETQPPATNQPATNEGEETGETQTDIENEIPADTPTE